MQRRIDLLDVVQNMALRDKEIFPAIVAEIFQAYPQPELPLESTPRPVSRLP